MKPVAGTRSRQGRLRVRIDGDEPAPGLDHECVDLALAAERADPRIESEVRLGDAIGGRAANPSFASVMLRCRPDARRS